MDDVIKILEIVDKTYPQVARLEDPVSMMVFLGATLDQWASDHGVSYGEQRELIKALADGHEFVNETFGSMPKSKISERMIERALQESEEEEVSKLINELLKGDC